MDIYIYNICACTGNRSAHLQYTHLTALRTSGGIVAEDFRNKLRSIAAAATAAGVQAIPSLLVLLRKRAWWLQSFL